MQPMVLPTSSQKRIQSDYYVEGYATTFDKPYLLCSYDGIDYYERVAPDALIGADLSDVIMQYNHEGRVLARMSNGSLGLEADSNGLFCYADLSRSTAAQELYEEIKSGLVTKMSWGFTVAEDEYDRVTHTRTIKRIAKVYDVSAVSIPANNDTEISVRSYLAGVSEIEKREALARQAKLLRLQILLEVNK